MPGKNGIHHVHQTFPDEGKELFGRGASVMLRCILEVEVVLRAALLPSSAADLNHLYGVMGLMAEMANIETEGELLRQGELG